MAPLLAELGTPSSTFVQEQDWLASVVYLAGVDNVSDLNTTRAPDTHDDFYATSTFVSAQAPLGAAAADALMAYWYGEGTRTGVQWFAIL